MSKIAVLIGKDFEDSEYTKPAEAFKQAGFDLVHIGLKKGEAVEGKKEQTPVQIDMDVKDARVGDFTALLIPGGYSPDNLRAFEEPVRFVKEFMQTGKPVLAICHGPQLLITAEVLKGRKLTAWKSLRVDVRNAGAEYIDKEVVVDGNLVSSRYPGDIPAFVEESLKKLKASGSAVEVEKGERGGGTGERKAA